MTGADWKNTRADDSVGRKTSTAASRPALRITAERMREESFMMAPYPVAPAPDRPIWVDTGIGNVTRLRGIPRLALRFASKVRVRDRLAAEKRFRPQDCSL